jgi:hypothetical protein
VSKKLKNSLVVVVFLVLGVVFYYPLRGPIHTAVRNLEMRYRPCSDTISYSIGDFDQKFGISKEDFLEAVQSAEIIWEKPAGKELFEYSTGSSDLKINLVYDYRQEATQKLNDIGITINSDQKTYNQLKVKHDSLVSEYEQQKIVLGFTVAQYENLKTAYE